MNNLDSDIETMSVVLVRTSETVGVTAFLDREKAEAYRSKWAYSYVREFKWSEGRSLSVTS
jgi:hypothetical protein